MSKIKIFLKFLIISLSILHIFSSSLPASENKKTAESKKVVILYFFWGEGCPYCLKQKLFLSSLKKKYPELEIKDYEVWHNQAPRDLLMTMAKSYGINPSGVPVTFIGDRSFVGFNDEIASKIEETLKFCLKKVCEDPLFYKKY